LWRPPPGLYLTPQSCVLSPRRPPSACGSLGSAVTRRRKRQSGGSRPGAEPLPAGCAGPKTAGRWLTKAGIFARIFGFFFTNRVVLWFCGGDQPRPAAPHPQGGQRLPVRPGPPPSRGEGLAAACCGALSLPAAMRPRGTRVLVHKACSSLTRRSVRVVASLPPSSPAADTWSTAWTLPQRPRI